MVQGNRVLISGHNTDILNIYLYIHLDNITVKPSKQEGLSYELSSTGYINPCPETHTQNNSTTTTTTATTSSSSSKTKQNKKNPKKNPKEKSKKKPTHPQDIRYASWLV